MKARAFVGLSLVMVATLALVTPVHAIRVCYDYVYYRLTEFCEGRGQDPAPPGAKPYLGLRSMIDYMGKNGYVMLTGPRIGGSTAPNRPVAGHQLKKGDVIVMDGHIGFANGPDNIDHFIQVEGTAGYPNALYGVSNLPSPATLGGRRGGFFQGDTLEQFLDRPSILKNRHFHVWRRVGLVSGSYRVDVVMSNGKVYPAVWRLHVSGNQITSTSTSEWDCCPGRRVDPLSGSIQGDRVIIERNCESHGVSGKCRQVYYGWLRNGVIQGSFSGSGAAPGNVWTLDLSSRSN